MSRRAVLRSPIFQFRNQAPPTIRRLPIQLRQQSTQLNATSRIVSRTQCASLRYFHTAPVPRIGLMSDEDTEKPREAEAHDQVERPTPMSEKEFHQHADKYMGQLLEKLEIMHEDQDVTEVEYSDHVLTIEAPQGTYVINKQAPNRQIWLSSPMSGPFHYDYVIEGDSMHQKEGASVQNWVSLKDGSKLDDLLSKELKVPMTDDAYEEHEGST